LREAFVNLPERVELTLEDKTSAADEAALISIVWCWKPYSKRVRTMSSYGDPFADVNILVSDITVSDIEYADVDCILDYWYGSSSEDLRSSLGIDSGRLPSRRMMREMLAFKISRRDAAPTILTVRVRDVSVGVHELTHIEPGISAVMHAHIWNAEHRGRGIGAVSYVRAMQRFFATHGFQRVIFETPSANVASNRLKKTLGISPHSKGTFFIPTMAEPIETTRYEVERSELPGIVDRIERNWRYRQARSA
jgi:RimJ/RimL family protein N-acetyltransferase